MSDVKTLKLIQKFEDDVPEGGRRSWIEVMSVSGDQECYVTVSRGDDDEDDVRVVILRPDQALKVARSLLSFAIRAEP